jgi:hypothetical protein
MAWSTPIDLYCERTDASFWAEPANALTNAAFLVAALAALALWRRCARPGAPDWPALALIVVVGAVGAGSFTFHTVATSGAVLADVIPIAAFIYGYLLLALRRFLHLCAAIAVAIVVAYAAAAVELVQLVPAGALNGSVGYVPALVALIAMAWMTRAMGSIPRDLAGAATIFTLSLALRAIDAAVCDTIPLGTHFLWHILNAVVLYMLLRTAILAGNPSGELRARRNQAPL